FRLLQFGFGQTTLGHLAGQLLRPFLDAERQLAAACMQVSDVNTMAAKETAREYQHERRIEPQSLIEMRLQREGERRAGLVPDTVVVAGDDAEGVASRRNVGVGDAAPARVPPLRLEPVQPESEAV